METIAGHAVGTLIVEIGVRPYRLWTVRNLAEHVDTEALLRDPDAPEPPYWAHLWPGSRVLARLVAEQARPGRRVLEIGCGLGLVGLVAADHGAEVTMFDHDPTGVAFAEANLTRHGRQADLRVADLLDPQLADDLASTGGFDLAVAADVTYDPALQEGLARLAARVLRPGGRLLCAESVRTLDRGLHRACEALGLRVEEREERDEDEGRPIRVRLTVVTTPVRE